MLVIDTVDALHKLVTIHLDDRMSHHIFYRPDKSETRPCLSSVKLIEKITVAQRILRRLETIKNMLVSKVQRILIQIATEFRLLGIQLKTKQFNSSSDCGENPLLSQLHFNSNSSDD